MALDFTFYALSVSTPLSSGFSGLTSLARYVGSWSPGVYVKECHSVLGVHGPEVQFPHHAAGCRPHLFQLHHQAMQVLDVGVPSLPGSTPVFLALFLLLCIWICVIPNFTI